MSRQPFIDGLEFASSGASASGTFAVRELPRLQDLLASDTGDIAYTVQGTRDEQGRPALEVRVRGVLQLRCQRCLEAMSFRVDLDERLVLAATQAEVDAAPSDPNAPDRVVAAREMPLRDMIEDELILAIPYAPRHESCQAHPGSEEHETRSPFANLRGLMRKN